MAGLPRGFKRGLLVGGILALLWGVLSDRRRRVSVGGAVVEKMRGLPLVGARASAALGDQLMDGIYRAIAEDVVSQAASGELLDMGGGPGRLAVEMARRARDLKITRLDPSPDSVQMAESRAYNAGVGRQVKVVHGDARDIPFPDQSFDFVVSFRGLDCSDTPEAILGEIHRVLRPGGKAWVYDFRRETPEEAWELAREQISLLAQPLFDMGIMAGWRAACNEAQIGLYTEGSPFKGGDIGAIAADIAGTQIRALTKVTLQK
ncbi:MAG: class I SAM-dependent methyltransferase [Sphingomonadaceae bacterium]